MTNHTSGQARPQAGSAPAGKSAVRVLIVAPAPVGEGRIGGIANFIRGFVRHMPDDFAVEIAGVAVGDEAPGTTWQAATLAGRPVRFLPVARMPAARRTGQVPIKAAVVAGLIRSRRRVDTRGRVLQVHSPAMELGLIGRHLPTIRVVHNAPEELAAGNGESAWHRLGRTLEITERSTFRRADRVFFVDQSTYQQYADRLGDAATHLRFLPNGVDTELFHPLDKDCRIQRRRDLAAELSIPVDARWLLFAGRLDHQKDPELLLRTFAEAKRSSSEEIILLIAGEGTLRAESERLSRDLGIDGQVRFLGLWQHERMPELMPAADAFVMSSVFEAAPFAVLEALASGVPVVSTSVGEVPRMVSHGSTGWIARDRTPEALSEGIAWALGQPRDEMAARCAASMAPYQIRNVLAPFYEEHRLLAATNV